MTLPLQMASVEVSAEHSAEALFRTFTACRDEKNPGKLVTPTTDWKRVLIR